ncbi:hypothetical protein D5F01_LYC23749 [Larimichthys crocea]|uniref:Uncharacterized protein n=1 Tax=Larimichthys crocea TaxID=215358 RepID=A0A6G0HGK4_LARCR|nr:hypothetical protein D5F01_LYC23749 [Larimichthys crocea]
MKLILTERPQSVEELKNIMQEKFKPRLDCDFSLQYEDPDFNGQLSVLMDIQELPEKGTLKVARGAEPTLKMIVLIPTSKEPEPERAEVNYLPNFPRGENETTLEEMRVQIIQETEKTERDQILIEKLMHTTFALRRQHIVQGSPQVREFLENWLALRMQSQVFAEFHRITNVNLRNQFYCELDQYTPKLAALYRQKSSRTGKGAEALREMLRIYDLEITICNITEEHDINMRRTLALRALPVYLREDDTEFFKTCNGEDEVEITDTQLALLSVVPDSIGSISFSPENISIVIEDEVVIISCISTCLRAGALWILRLQSTPCRPPDASQPSTLRTVYPLLSHHLLQSTLCGPPDTTVSPRPSGPFTTSETFSPYLFP